MDEREWLACSDPARMMGALQVGTPLWHTIAHVTPGGVPKGFPPSDRKLRLFACACCRQAQYASENDIMLWEAHGFDHGDLEWATRWAGDDGRVISKQVRADLLHHIVGNPFRPILSRPCGECKGDGWLNVADRIKAGGDVSGDNRWCVCGGKGWLVVEPPTVKCLQCQGSGWLIKPFEEKVYPGIGKYKAECERCRGTGRLPSWPATVTQLAQSVYDGQWCEFALSDSLRECGYDVLADHFAGSAGCMRGCAFVDVILNLE